MSNATQTNVGLFTSERGDVKEHLAPYQFKVREEPIVTESGLIVEGRRAIVRTDNDTVLGTVGGNYKVLTHGEALDPILKALKKKNVETFKRVALTQGGARMYANVYFPGQELNLPTNNNRRDTCWPGITVVNSLDGTLKYALEATIYRLACTNGMRVPTAIATLRTTHSKNKDYDKMVEEILSVIGDSGKFVTLQKWANKVLTPEKMIALAETIIKTKGSQFPKRYLEEVNAEIQKETKFGVVSVWGLYNAFNSVLEHNLVRGKGKLERARMLDENLFKTFNKVFK